MPFISQNLNLPYIAPAQAQKHVTHNEALRALDAIVQLSLVSTSQTTPPASPVEGDRYFVAAAATSAWETQDGQIAAYQDGAWAFYAPRSGWQAWIEDESNLQIWDGTSWENAAPVPDYQNLTQIGINTTADVTNRLSVSSPATLLTHAGNGHQLKLNKNAAGDTGSILYQSNWSGRAEIGLTGDDDFHFKVSPDGNAFHEGIIIDKDDGKVSFPNGASVKRCIDIGGRFYCYTNNRWVLPSTNYGFASENHSTNGGTGAEPSIAHLQIGAFLRAGTKVTGIVTGIRCNSTEVTGIDIRIFFQYGPWNNSWDSSSETTRDAIYTEDDFSVFGADWILFDPAITNYTCPDNGFIVIAIKPRGALTSTRYIYTNGIIETIVPA